jgi:hypothetical protein
VTVASDAHAAMPSVPLAERKRKVNTIGLTWARLWHQALQRLSRCAQVTQDDERDAFRAQLTDAEDWLYMDPEAEKGNADTFRGKLASLNAVGEPIAARAREAAARTERVTGAKLLIDLVKKAGKDWPATRPWLNATQVSSLVELVRHCFPVDNMLFMLLYLC